MTDSKEKADEFPRFAETSPARTKTGRLRELFDEISAAQTVGWRLDAIVRGLAEQQLPVSVGVLKTTLKRIRAEREATGRTVSQALKRKPVQAATTRADKPALEATAERTQKFSSEGYREPLLTFTRDPMKRRNWELE